MAFTLPDLPYGYDRRSLDNAITAAYEMAHTVSDHFL
jgi:hypothetical protein